MTDKALKLIGLMRRANAIQIGETNTGITVRNGKAKLLLIAKDASENARHRAENFAAGRNVEIVCLPYLKEEISESVGLPGCSMAAVTDIGFANALMKILAAADADAYAGLSLSVEQRFNKAERRRNKAQTSDSNKRIG